MIIRFSLFLKQQKGITSIEYGLIALALAAFLVNVLYGDTGLTTAIKEKFEILSALVIKTLA
ncbi:Flp family type IVb pilin [Cricetibacter osteomyelitidis]|uniref:Flp family type IVb pilin n=1 Tax=Cricetibacter osteomyelitidis TaxID=1521931 RepID=UPI00104CFE6A|nr:Flp family type IVb pilin [Cricetibacter osteomyelitidis]